MDYLERRAVTVPQPLTFSRLTDGFILPPRAAVNAGVQGHIGSSSILPREREAGMGLTPERVRWFPPDMALTHVVWIRLVFTWLRLPLPCSHSLGSQTS